MLLNTNPLSSERMNLHIRTLFHDGRGRVAYTIDMVKRLNVADIIIVTR